MCTHNIFPIHLAYSIIIVINMAHNKIPKNECSERGTPSLMANYITSLVYIPNYTIKTSKGSKSEEVIIYLDAMVHPLPSITFGNRNTPFSSSHPPSPPSNQPMLQIIPLSTDLGSTCPHGTL
jgi:hypothetical protein